MTKKNLLGVWCHLKKNVKEVIEKIRQIAGTIARKTKATLQ